MCPRESRRQLWDPAPLERRTEGGVREGGGDQAKKKKERKKRRRQRCCKEKFNPLVKEQRP